MRLLIILMITVGLIAIPVGCLHAINEDTRMMQQCEREWMQFSMQHHCKIVREPGWDKPRTLWQCDGNFQVER